MVIGGVGGGGTLQGTSQVNGDNTTATPSLLTGINLTVVQSVPPTGTVLNPNSVIFASNVNLITGTGIDSSTAPDPNPAAGTVNINAISANNSTAIIINAGATVTANGVVELNTGNFQLNGNLVASNVNLNGSSAAGTISAVGNLDLSKIKYLNLQWSKSHFDRHRQHHRSGRWQYD